MCWGSDVEHTLILASRLLQLLPPLRLGAVAQLHRLLPELLHQLALPLELRRLLESRSGHLLLLPRVLRLSIGVSRRLQAGHGLTALNSNFFAMRFFRRDLRGPARFGTWLSAQSMSSLALGGRSGGKGVSVGSSFSRGTSR